MLCTNYIGTYILLTTSKRNFTYIKFTLRPNLFGRLETRQMTIIVSEHVPIRGVPIFLVMKGETIADRLMQVERMHARAAVWSVRGSVVEQLVCSPTEHDQPYLILEVKTAPEIFSRLESTQ